MNGTLGVTSFGNQNEGKGRHMDSPGIVVLSSSLRLLHINQRACELSKQLHESGSGPETDSALPPAVRDLAEEIRTQLRVRMDSHQAAQFQITRQITNRNAAFLLKGFGLPSQRGFDRSRIVVLLS